MDSNKSVIQYFPKDIEDTNMFKFIKKHGMKNYEELYRYSIEKNRVKDFFWRDIIKYFDIVYEGNIDNVYNKKTFIDYNWFPEVNLNYAENLLKNKHSKIIFEHESGINRIINRDELVGISAEFQNYISDTIGVGDIVACYMPNIPETVISMLGTTSVGGIFSSVSCDFGGEGVTDRFLELNPKVLVTASSYSYNGNIFCLRKNIEYILKKIKSIKKVIIVNFLENNCRDLGDTWNFKNNNKTLNYNRVNFKSPLYVMFSSGTTGKPKCIVHSVGGTLLQHVKELGLHVDLKNNKNLFYYTTCGWMMWNWLVSGLYFSSITLYEGSCSNFKKFLDIINRHKINIFGTSPKFLKSLEQSGYNNEINLEPLETILSTGSVLYDEQFDFVYSKLKKNVILSSISGGTDILGCFMLGNPIKPVRKGEITCKGLGMDIDAYDKNGKSTEQKGELVCKQSFPSQPIYFLNDAENKKYKEAYFSKFSNIWRHGDFIKILKSGGIRVFGRSDYTLNPGGVRIGTSEIYRILETVYEIDDSICIGVKHNFDEVVLLFVKLKKEFDFNMIKEILKTKLTPRHVPKYIYEVNYIPYTKNGKKLESKISKIFNKQKIKIDESLKEYYDIASNFK